MKRDDPLRIALNEAARIALEQHGDLRAVDEKIADAIAKANEVDANGKATQAAKTARRLLSNPHLVSTHPNRTHKRLKKTAAEAEADADKAAAEFVAKQTVARIARQAEQDFAREREVNELEDPKPNRTRGDYNLEFLRPFYRHFDEQKVSRSAFARAPQWILSTCAMLIGWAARDPQLQDHRNPARGLWRAGILQTRNPEISDAEAQAIDSAVALGLSEEFELLGSLNALRSAYPQPVSSSFLMACVRIAENANALSRYEQSVVYEAGQHLRSNEIRIVQSICGLTDDQADEAEKVVYFFKRASWDLRIEKLLQDHAVVTMRDHVDRIQPDACGPETWVPELVEKLEELAKTYAPVVRSEEAFFGILAAAIRNSAAMRKFEGREAVERFNTDLKAINESIRVALASGERFKFNEMGFAITEDDPQFHYIAQKPMTAEEYLGSPGFNYPSPDELPTVASFDLANDLPFTEAALRASGLTEKQIEDFNYEVRFACENNLEFKIDGTTIVDEMLEDQYRDLDARVWNRDLWIEAYGSLPKHKLYPD